MPLYEYECTKCGHRFEVIQKFSDPPRTECPRCSGSVRKLLSAPAIQFKGSGWYVTDYARGGGGKEKPEGAKQEGEGKGESSSKKDSKSDKKKDPS